MTVWLVGLWDRARDDWREQPQRWLGREVADVIRSFGDLSGCDLVLYSISL